MVGQIKIPERFDIEDVEYSTDALSDKSLDIFPGKYHINKDKLEI